MKSLFTPAAKRSLTSLSLAIASALIVAGAVTGCKMSPDERAEKATSHVSSRLNFDESQKTEFQKLARLAAQDYKAMQADRKLIAAEVEKQIISEKADTTELKKLMAAQNKKREELTTKWIDLTAEFHARLKPEQKQKALKLLKKFTDRWNEKDED